MSTLTWTAGGQRTSIIRPSVSPPCDRDSINGRRGGDQCDICESTAPRPTLDCVILLGAEWRVGGSSESCRRKEMWRKKDHHLEEGLRKHEADDSDRENEGRM